MSKIINDTCRLCLQKKSLMKSHIYPEFMYKPMYDKDHRFNVLSNDRKGIIKNPPKGFYEKLLCDDCEGIIKKYEDHAAKVLFGDGKYEILTRKTKYGIEIGNTDYQLFKLFQLSLLWRASVSSLPEFSQIDLGPHTDIIRKMIFNKDPCKYYEYGVMIFYFPNLQANMIDCIRPHDEMATRIEGHRVYRAIFNGLFWIHFISSHMKSYRNKDYFLSTNNILPLIDAQMFESDFVRNILGEYFNMV